MQEPKCIVAATVVVAVVPGSVGSRSAGFVVFVLHSSYPSFFCFDCLVVVRFYYFLFKVFKLWEFYEHIFPPIYTIFSTCFSSFSLPNKLSLSFRCFYYSLSLFSLQNNLKQNNVKTKQELSLFIQAAFEVFHCHFISNLLVVLWEKKSC